MRMRASLCLIVTTTFLGCGGGGATDAGRGGADGAASDAPVVDGAQIDGAVVDAGDHRDSPVVDTRLEDVVVDAVEDVVVDTAAAVDVSVDGAAAAPDRPAEAAVLAARSFDVLVKVTPGGTSPSGPPPAEHRMTVWIDPVNDRMVAGANGSVAVGKLVRAADGTMSASLEGHVEFEESYQSRCHGWGWFDYSELVLTVEGDRISGRARGQATVVAIDVAFPVSFTGTVEGAPDVTPPRSSIRFEPGRREHPSRSIRPDPTLGYLIVSSSEPLDPATRAFLVVGGRRQELSRDFRPDGRPIGYFGPEPGVPLPFDAVHAVVFDPPAADLAGHRAGDVAPLRAPAPPAHLAEDGFEGPVTATLLGAATVVEDDAALGISGRRAVMIPATRGETPGITGRFTARLRVQPGDTQVHATIRVLGPNSASRTQFRRMLVSVAVGVAGSVEHRFAEIPEPSPEGWSNQRQMVIGPPTPIALPIPPGATEVIVDVLQALLDCHLTQEGLVIDDLRAE
jgi:hypothetical protein